MKTHEAFDEEPVDKTEALPDLPPALQVYTVPEAAKVLRCHPEKVYALVRTGDLKGTRLVHALRIAREELERFIRDGSAQAREDFASSQVPRAKRQ